MTIELIESPGISTDWTDLLQGVVLAFISAYICIHLFLQMIERMGMLPFVVYRLLLGIVLFGLTL